MKRIWLRLVPKKARPKERPIAASENTAGKITSVDFQPTVAAQAKAPEGPMYFEPGTSVVWDLRENEFLMRTLPVIAKGPFEIIATANFGTLACNYKIAQNGIMKKNGLSHWWPCVLFKKFGT